MFSAEMTAAAIEAELCSRLGVSKVIWLPLGAAHDVDTNGHVRHSLCIVSPLPSWRRRRHQRPREAQPVPCVSAATVA